LWAVDWALTLLLTGCAKWESEGGQMIAADRVRRRAVRFLLVGTLAMCASLLAWVQPAQAQEEDPSPGWDQPLPDDGSSPPPDQPPPNEAAPGDDGSSGDPPPEVVADVQATIEEVAGPIAAAEEQTAEQQFIIAVLLKVADLKGRYGNTAGPGEVIPSNILAAIDNELTDFLRPYADQLCRGTLVLTGDLSSISDEIAQRLRFRAWYLLVTPALVIWLFFRISMCVNRLLDQVLANGSPLAPCAIANGHYELRWTSIRPQLFRSQSEAVSDSYRYLHETGQLPMSQAAWATRWQSVEQPPASWFCFHD
jgi:hypothetical protein